jgi:biopolymer transport protein ExbD
MGGGGGGEEGEFGFQIAPMVDVVFVLLLFFMACAGQTVTEGLLKIALPNHAKSEAAIKTPVVIDIDANGNVSANGKSQPGNPLERDIPALVEFLKTVMSTDKELPVVIRPSLEAKHERLIDVLNACRIAKVTNLTFG